MESVSKQEYMRVLSELDMLSTKFVALEQENQRLLGDLQQVSAEKVQQVEELSQRVHQLEATLLQRQAVEVQTSPKEPNISLPAKFDGTGSQFHGFLNQVRLVIKLHPSRYPCCSRGTSWYLVNGYCISVVRTTSREALTLIRRF